MNITSKQVLARAYKLYTLGKTVERKRKKVDALIQQGYPSTSPEILAANTDFNRAAFEWQQLETEYIQLVQAQQ